MQLFTERCRLLPFQERDVSLFHCMNTEPSVRQFLWDDEIISLEMAQDIITQNWQLFVEKGYGLWKLLSQEDNTLIGYVGLWHFFEESQAQLIYALLPAHTGKGYATEAGRCIIDYAFNQLGYSYIMAATDEPHLASQKVLHRLGMELHKKEVKDGKSTLFFQIKKTDQ